VITKIRRPGGERPPGSALVGAAALLLALLAAGLFVVSLAAQYRYVFGVKHESVPSAIEAIGLDAGMTVFSLLALGLAVAGQPARIERALIVVCAVASAGQNYAAADVTSPRSVAAYVMPPLFLALVVDRVVAVMRRHVLGDAERSVWAAAGRSLAAAARALGVVLLYLLRFMLAPPSTCTGLRRLVLNATPVPVVPPRQVPPAAVPPALGPPPVTGPPGSADGSGEARSPAADARPQAAGSVRAARGGAARRPRNGGRPAAARPPVTYEAVAAHYADRLAAGQVPSGKEIRAQWRIGSGKAGEFHARLAAAEGAVRPAGAGPPAAAAPGPVNVSPY